MAVCFTINGKIYHASPDRFPIDTTLNEFIRNHAHLSGTKFMCLEGDCGVCIVNIRGEHPVSRERTSFAVNSCLLPIFACHRLDIVTIEGIGSKADGYHPLQQRLADFNGTQCGMCSPGMVMNMYGLLESSGSGVKMEEIEESFAGNVCRCTGYRPILDAFKSFASDASGILTQNCTDIEDIGTLSCSKSGNSKSLKCSKCLEMQPIHLFFEGEKEWHKVYSVDQVFQVLERIGCKPYQFISGGTGHTVLRRGNNLDVFIDITSVEELHSHWIGGSLIIGANVTLTEFIKILKDAAQNAPNFKYCEQMAKHVARIAHLAVRNRASLAGNLCLKNQHRNFASDLYVILEAVAASLTIVQNDGQIITLSPQQFIRHDMSKKLILNISLPPQRSEDYLFRTYRAESRAQNGQVYVNGAIAIELHAKQQRIRLATVCFGGINSTFTHAVETEKFLSGKQPYNNDILQKALSVLELELKPSLAPSLTGSDFRKQLCLGIFYKFFLETAPRKSVHSKYKTGGLLLERPLTTNSQSYNTYPTDWPITKNVPKLESLAQTAGETSYVNDTPSKVNDLYAAFVIAIKPRTTIQRIDATNALKMPGVIMFLSAKDIPGKNDFMPFNHNVNYVLPIGNEPEEIFCSGKVLFHGQPLGIILANSFQLANRAAKLVSIEYSNPDGQRILPTLKHVQLENGLDRLANAGPPQIGPDYNSTDREYSRISGQYLAEGQYHYTLETQSCVCVPIEDGLDVFPSTQSTHHVQAAISGMLGMPQNKINVITGRVGGAYGCKITRSSQIACACALGAYVTQRPVRFVLTMESNMTSIGKRKGCLSEYEVIFLYSGNIVKLTNTFTVDCGAYRNDPQVHMYKAFFKSCYNDRTWKLIPMEARTDAPTNTWLRSPGTAEAIGTIETIMEHIAFESEIDPLDVRMTNIPADSKMREVLPQFRKDVEYDDRKTAIERFNSSNRWKKRGISIVPLAYPMTINGSTKAWVSIYHIDGSVSITHGGVEMGQGVNTKAVQVTAQVFGIPVEKITVKPHNTLVTPNATVSAGGMASDHVVLAVRRACEILMERIAPVREANIGVTWEALVNICFTLNLSLTASYASKAEDHVPYTVWAVGCSEIELDVLTGNIVTRRVDILEDAGRSINPGIDIGQIEGSFIMGLGYYLNEALHYDPATGALINNRAMTYKPPGPKDIPTDFRISLMYDSPNNEGVLRSKATEEPAYNLAISAVFALRYALLSARKDAGLKAEWISLGAPSTPDQILPLTGSAIEHFILTDNDE